MAKIMAPAAKDCIIVAGHIKHLLQSEECIRYLLVCQKMMY